MSLKSETSKEECAEYSKKLTEFCKKANFDLQLYPIRDMHPPTKMRIKAYMRKIFTQYDDITSKYMWQRAVQSFQSVSRINVRIKRTVSTINDKPTQL